MDRRQRGKWLRWICFFCVLVITLLAISIRNLDSMRALAFAALQVALMVAILLTRGGSGE